MKLTRVPTRIPTRILVGKIANIMNNLMSIILDEFQSMYLYVISCRWQWSSPKIQNSYGFDLLLEKGDGFT